MIKDLATCGAYFLMGNTQTPGLRHGYAQKLSKGRERKPQEESSGATYRVSLFNLRDYLPELFSNLGGFCVIITHFLARYQGWETEVI